MVFMARECQKWIPRTILPPVGYFLVDTNSRRRPRREKLIPAAATKTRRCRCTCVLLEKSETHGNSIGNLSRMCF